MNIEKAKKFNKKFEPEVKQLLARSRYFLYKSRSKWSINQTRRVQLLFQLHPETEKAYHFTQDLHSIF
ncbi:transposase [Flavobacterium anhuiense]|uniref:transposase n=1 Tax=Flavobacterium anhuiense TaxID=459526 RepID=UPI003D97E2A6